MGASECPCCRTVHKMYIFTMPPVEGGEKGHHLSIWSHFPLTCLTQSRVAQLSQYRRDNAVVFYGFHTDRTAAITYSIL